MLLLDERDNVVVCCRPVRRGEHVVATGIDIVVQENVERGHKLARHSLRAGDRVVKYGMAIGSMTAPAVAGAWIHLHNMQSDYLRAHTRVAGEQR